MSPILVTLMSRSDSDFERSNVSLKKLNLMAFIRTLTISTTTFERTKEKLYGFQQPEYVIAVVLKSEEHGVLVIAWFGE